MKKSFAILLLLILIIPLAVFSQQREEINPKNDFYVKHIPNPLRNNDFCYSERRDSDNFTNSKLMKSEATLNNEYLLSEKLAYNWNGNNWELVTRGEYKYDSNYNRIEDLIQFLDGSVWRGFQRTLFKYDSNNNCIEKKEQFIEYSVWVTIMTTLYTYDSNNNCIEHLHQTSGGVDWSRCFYTYDANNNNTEHIQQLREGNNWVNWYRHISYTYDSNNNLTYVLGQEWANSNWVDQWKDLYSYDTYSNKVEYIGSYWNVIKWTYSVIYKYSYDSNNMIEKLRQDWYDSEWNNERKELFSYEQITAIDVAVPIKDYKLSNNYPNPFNPSTKIKYSIPKRSNVTLKVFDVLGSEVITLVNKEQAQGNYEIEFDATGYASGIYFVRMQVNDFVNTKKIILLK